MSELRVVGAALIRAVTLTLLSVSFQVAISTSESTDALGAGLLFFLILVLVAFGWAAYDGVRRGFLPAAGLWMLTAVLAGVGLTVAFLVTVTGETGLVDELKDSGIFFALLVAVPALSGAGLGGLVRRQQSPTIS